MKRKQGFTLIELLAVIIILAVIAIITTPIVLNVIKSSKEKANLNSAYGLIDGAKLYYSDSFLDDTKGDKIKNGENIWNDVAIQGNKPKEGELYLNENGGIALSVIYDNVCYLKNFTEELQVLKNESCELSYTGTDQIPPTVTIDPLEVVLTIGDNYDLLTGVTAIDSDSGVSKITVKIGENEITSTRDLTFGTYTLIYEVTDKTGNCTRVTRKLTVGDKNALTYILNHESLVNGMTTGLHRESDHFGDVIYRYKSISKDENPNNYVKIDGNIYRILSISEDGSLKLLFLNTEISFPFHSTNDRMFWGSIGRDGFFIYKNGDDKAVIKGTSDTTSKIYLNEQYYNTLSEKMKNMIVEGTWYVGGYDAYWADYHNTYDTLLYEQVYYYSLKANIGLLNIEEYYQASANRVGSPFLKYGCSSWITGATNITAPQMTLTLIQDRTNFGYAVVRNPQIYSYPFNTQANVSPVMNLKSNIRITSGTGTVADPYIID